MISRDSMNVASHFHPSVERSFWNFMIVHTDEIQDKLLGVVCKISKIGTQRFARIEIFKVKSLVFWSISDPVAVARSLEVLVRDLDFLPISIQGLDHVRSLELHLVNELAPEKLKKC